MAKNQQKRVLKRDLEDAEGKGPSKKAKKEAEEEDEEEEAFIPTLQKDDSGDQYVAVSGRTMQPCGGPDPLC